jgi:hypothetical protein
MMNEEECYEALNSCMHCLIGYHNNDDWQSKPLSAMMQAFREVEEFLVRFPSCFLAQRWNSTITSYLTDMDAAPTTLEVVAPSPAKSVVTLARATSSSNAHQCQCYRLMMFNVD